MPNTTRIRYGRVGGIVSSEHPLASVISPTITNPNINITPFPLSTSIIELSSVDSNIVGTNDSQFITRTSSNGQTPHFVFHANMFTVFEDAYLGAFSALNDIRKMELIQASIQRIAFRVRVGASHQLNISFASNVTNAWNAPARLTGATSQLDAPQTFSIELTSPSNIQELVFGDGSIRAIVSAPPLGQNSTMNMFFAELVIEHDLPSSMSFDPLEAFPDQKRFAIIPLSYSNRERAFTGEIIMDNQSNVWLKQGTNYVSATNSLREAFDDHIAHDKVSAHHVRNITGLEDFMSDISGFVYNHTHDWITITNKPDVFPPRIGTGATDAAAGNHTHTFSQILEKPVTYPPTIGSGPGEAAAGDHVHSWEEIERKPLRYPPIIGTGPNEAAAGDHVHEWDDILNKPDRYPAIIGTSADDAAAGNHQHDASDIISGIIEEDRLPSASLYTKGIVMLGREPENAAPGVHGHDISDISGEVPVSQLPYATRTSYGIVRLGREDDDAAPGIHDHDTSDIVSGVMDRDRLPIADKNEVGVVRLGREPEDATPGDHEHYYEPVTGTPGHDYGFVVYGDYMRCWGVGTITIPAGSTSMAIMGNEIIFPNGGFSFRPVVVMTLDGTSVSTGLTFDSTSGLMNASVTGLSAHTRSITSFIPFLQTSSTSARTITFTWSAEGYKLMPDKTLRYS